MSSDEQDEVSSAPPPPQFPLLQSEGRRALCTFEDNPSRCDPCRCPPSSRAPEWCLPGQPAHAMRGQQSDPVPGAGRPLCCSCDSSL